MHWITQNWMWIVLTHSLVIMHIRHTKAGARYDIAQCGNEYRPLPAKIAHLSGKRSFNVEHQQKPNHG